MKKFFKNKKNIILLVLIGVALIALAISSVVEFMVPISCILGGIASIYGAYIMLLKYVEIKNSRVDEFITEENKLKNKASKFLQSENKINFMLLIGMFFLIGLVLVYAGIKIVTG